MSIAPSRQAVIAAYRNLLKTQKEVFGADAKAIIAARKETHARFMQFKDETNTDILEEKLTLADQVATLLRRNVVQAVPKEGEDSLYHLRITKDTELGDNDSIKKAKNIFRKKKNSKNNEEKTHSCCSGH
ncbi:uncharacterized protein BYT42DRAFT_561402 [Radiomyces spectabilis]|uniref:uncharacterized protein n=1 Tax=Radiomyces spectabilis TaxID=64574 RepID=UPI00221FE7D5|nr:uncharacterized protein BYT42DRAFT_561402 [Radiomyces spectabilis]KAI8388836.1 hypothetical protein BYT42DRAFT_561402 [Radiomyces spectabilis]